MDKEEFYRIAKEEGFIETFKKLLDQKVEGDPWKERYIPVLSIIAVIITALAMPISNIVIENSRSTNASKIGVNESEKYLIREKFAVFCGSLVSSDIGGESYESDIFRKFYSIQSLIPREDLKDVHRSIDLVLKEPDFTKRKKMARQTCYKLGLDLDDLIKGRRKNR
ncbi:hypothetical protein [Thalassotalea euphylliae]|uniref:Uncharacterized protein n=1 Tax=Thalassotalea euphylliae TaxID=1655234 RepID=A0A3E0UHM9_9GAMM|nr:hypothetical protein [Thalassotalea euphylliae]REL36104.1 hypothetical protein DXX92_12670 [Thalassotalea euphylliae]